MENDTGSILIVDDDADVLLAAAMVLKKQFRSVVTERDPDRLPELLNRQSFDVILLDMNFTSGVTAGEEGLRWLQLIKETSPATQVVLMTAYGGVAIAVRAMQAGASDFVIKPWDNAKLLATTVAAQRHSRSDQEVRALRTRQRMLNRIQGGAPQEIIGASGALQQVLADIDKVARTDANVLILGENGTGKELVARAIHQRSMRADQAFVAVDLGAIAESLFESEMFGHKRGAFTDAKEDRPGRFEIASGGTLFLDEIGNLSLQTQAKLLGALETAAVTRVGADQARKVDIRLICATNMPVYEMLDQYRFRQDLLYRVNTIELRLPPLRDRVSDIALLARHFASLYARKYHRPNPRLDADTIAKLERYHWPGNIRELKHAIERAVIMAETEVLRPDDFLLAKPRPAPDPQVPLNLDAMEKDTIQKAILKHNGNLSRAAQELGLGRATLYRKIARYGL